MGKMREILFRGKDIKTGIWRLGSLVSLDVDSGHVFIVPVCDRASTLPVSAMMYYTAVYVDKGTVGQFTGLTDKNGKKIFEGDIIKADNGRQLSVSIVKFGKYFPKMFYQMLDMFCPGKQHLPSIGFYAESICKSEEMILFQSGCVEVIGNIYDNPEFLEV